MLLDAALAVGSYVIGTIPIAYVAGRLVGGVDLREYGSANPGASNVWQSVSRWLVAPVGLAQIAQGAAGAGAAVLLDRGDGVAVAAALAAVVAADWNPWLGFSGGRGIGVTIGALLALAPVALVAFIVVALVGVAMRAIPQGVACGLLAAPLAAFVAEDPATVVLGCALLAVVALVKRMAANGAPAPADAGAYVNRLIYDRDIRDREAWVRRNVEAGQRRG